ncbi:MAG: hypothetical protein NTX12_06970 [Actinobacteria bacterium]|nr:hypothetical protein [Actinomycetota bacterium]
MVARPLVLKSQVGRSGKSIIAAELPIARVLVDTGVYHLDTPFDYLVPESQSLLAQVGVRVEIPFGNVLREGIIVQRLLESASSGTLKEISKILSPHPIATTETLELFSRVAKRWSANPYDVIRSAIPPRVQSVDRSFSPLALGERVRNVGSGTVEIPGIFQKKNVRAFWALPCKNEFSELITELIRTRSNLGQVLVVAPDEATLESFYEDVKKFYPLLICARIDGQVSRSERYLNFLRMVNGDVDIAFGMRGAVFAPLASPSTVIVVGESSHLLYEVRSPGWNARDIAIDRSEIEKISVVLVGYSPSLEAARLIDESFLSLVSSKQRRHVLAVDSSQGELLPSKIFPLIRKALKDGPALFLVPSKGYGNAILCGKCRNVALCSCGGKLQRRKADEPPVCAVCAKQYVNWKCSWCQSDSIYIASRGIDRFAEEIGRAFPNTPIVNSSGDHIIRSISQDSALVVATPGAVPRSETGYAAVALLQGMRFFGHSDLRSSERAKDLFFDVASHVSVDGSVCAVIDPAHPIVAALTIWDPTMMARRELSEQLDAQLPPYWRVVIIELDSKSAVALVTGLNRAKDETRLPPQTKILGPFEKENGKSRITVSAPADQAESMIDFIHELQRRRSISGKPLYSLRVDPYSLA